MKKRILVIGIFILCVVLLSSIGYFILFHFISGNSGNLPAIENPKEIYRKAASAVTLQQDVILNIQQTYETSVDGAVFVEVSEKIFRYDIGDNHQTNIELTELHTSGTNTVSIREVCANNKVYLTINDASFVSDCSTADYISQQIPPVLLDQNKYNNISGADTGEGYILYFSEPIAQETWLTEADITLLNASGTASVNYDGALTENTYTVSYTKNGVTFRETVRVAISYEDITVTIPENTQNFTPVSYWQGLRMLEQASGYLLQAKSISATYQDSIYFQAIGDRRNQTISINAHKSDTWYASIKTDINLTNDIRLEQTTNYTKQELFLDNQYSLSEDGAPPSVNAGITVDTVCNYFRTQLVSTVMLPQFISGSEISETENTLRINFTGTDDFADFLTENACQILYQDPGLIVGSENGITADMLQCYLEVDKVSGLPVGSGIQFEGTYYTEGLPYRLQYHAEQAYALPSHTAIGEIESLHK